MRSKYHTYPEYHTSADNLDFISEKGLSESLEVMKRIIETVEANEPLYATNICEPMLSKHGLRSKIGGKAMGTDDIMNILAYADGSDALDIADIIGRPLWEIAPTIKMLKEKGLLK